MRIDVITVLPELVEHAVSQSIIGRARTAGIVEIAVHNLRDYTTDKHKTTDDTPCGGGGGMIMKPEPFTRAVEAVSMDDLRPRVILTDPRGRRFDQSLAVELSQEQQIVLLCGRYEGVDDRVRSLVTDELSIGDYVLTGGELPALVIVDAVVRLLPGALGDEFGASKDTFSDGLLEHPQYTRPREFEGMPVPDILFTGDHARIERWRRWHRLTRTRDERPDLWATLSLSLADVRLAAGSEPE